MVILRSVVVAALLYPRFARAQRPLDSTDASVVGAKQLELEVAPVGLALEGDEASVPLPSITVTAGFGWLELGVAGNHELVWADGDPDGVLTGSAAAKVVVREGGVHGRSGPSVAAQLAVGLPEVGSGDPVAVTSTAIVSQRVPGMQVHVNGDLVQDDEVRFAGGVAFVIAPDADLRPIVDVRVATGQTGTGLVGVVYSLGPRLVLDGAVKAGWTDGVGVYEARAGFTWTVPTDGRASYGDVSQTPPK